MSVCIVCGEPITFGLGHTYHHPACSALETGNIEICECGGLDECHEHCCPTCHPPRETVDEANARLGHDVWDSNGDLW